MHLAMFAAGLIGLAVPPADPPQVDLVGTSSSLCLLIGNRNVQRELGLDEAQARKCESLCELTRDRLQATYRSVESRGSSRGARDLQEIEKSFSNETVKSISEILTPPQIARLKQISLQSGTVATFLEPSVRAALKLDDRQAGKMRGLHEGAKRTIQAEVRAGKVARSEVRKRALALSQEGRAKALAELDPEQRATWDAMIGGPFFLEAGSPRPEAGPAPNR